MRASSGLTRRKLRSARQTWLRFLLKGSVRLELTARSSGSALKKAEAGRIAPGKGEAGEIIIRYRSLDQFETVRKKLMGI
jgi:hypothetical protein